MVMDPNTGLEKTLAGSLASKAGLEKNVLFLKDGCIVTEPLLMYRELDY